MHLLQEILARRGRGDAYAGVYSVCSANEYVISAALEEGVRTGTPALIEATANQVNQDGGYTGMTPAIFRDYVLALAKRAGFDESNLILGGDHLGPLTWRGECESVAMAKAEILIRDYAAAGFTKIHIDTSMRLADDDPSERLSDSVIASRAARLAAVAEEAWRSAAAEEERRSDVAEETRRNAVVEEARRSGFAEEARRNAVVEEARCGEFAPVYVIGSEVPIPGGAREDGAEAETCDDANESMPGGAREDDIGIEAAKTEAGKKSNAETSGQAGIQISTSEQLLATYETFKRAFTQSGLEDAFARVIAIVVQPGVEFGDDEIVEYDRKKAAGLIKALPGCGGLVFEGHSTDYQTKYKLREMVADGVAILKVGPALTFALREALFALEGVERELLGAKAAYGMEPSGFQNALEEGMLKKPGEWDKHYRGGADELHFKRRFSFSDRARYFLPDESVVRAIDRLIINIDSLGVPLSVVSQYLPTVYTAIREGRCAEDAASMLKMRVKDCIGDYLYALDAEPARGTDISDADISGVDISCGSIRNVNMANAKIIGCDLSGAEISDCKIDGMTMKIKR